MANRRCEYCRNRLPDGMRVDAAFCGDNCRINAHKKRKREFTKEWKLSKSYRPIVSYPNHALWTPLLEQLRHHYPRNLNPVGYRLMRKGSIYPNPKERIRIVNNDYREASYYYWSPFEPPSVPEAGEYKLQWWIGADAVSPDFHSESIHTCFVPIADPQARFHHNYPNKETISGMAWKRQVTLKMKQFK